jgi:hypothetical protein
MDGTVPDVIDSIVINLGSDSDSVSESDREGSTSSDWRGFTSTGEWAGKCVLNW